MSIEKLKKDGWFDKGSELPPLSQSQINTLKEGKELTISNNGETYLIYIKDKKDSSRIDPSDVVIRKIPNAARPAEI